MNRPTINRETDGKISKSPWITLAIISCVGLISMFADTMILPAIHYFIKDFKISYNTSSCILASFLITGAVMTPITGRLSDIYGKKILLIILGIYAIGISVAALSNNFTSLLIARVIQGIGVLMFPIAFGIIRDTFTPEKLAVAQGIFTSMFSAGAVIGVAVGEIIIKNFRWHATFLVVIPISIALLAIISKFIYLKADQVISGSISDKNAEFCCRFIHVRKDILLSENISNSNNISKNKSTIDIMDAITLSVTIISFLVALQLTQTINAAGANIIPTVIVFGVAAIISLLFFVRAEKKIDSPLIDLNLLANKILLPANVINMVVGITSLMVYIRPYLY